MKFKIKESLEEPVKTWLLITDSRDAVTVNYRKRTKDFSINTTNPNWVVGDCRLRFMTEEDANRFAQFFIEQGRAKECKVSPSKTLREVVKIKRASVYNTPCPEDIPLYVSTNYLTYKGVTKDSLNESFNSNLIDRFFKDSSWIDEIRDRLQYLNQKDLEIEYNEDPIVKLIIDNAHEYNTEDNDYEGIVRDFINFTEEFMFYINDEDKESFNELINENPFMKTFFEIYNREWPDWDKIEEDMKYYPQDYDKIDLEYKKLDLEDRVIDWTYEVDKEDLYTFIFEDCIDEEDFPVIAEDEFDPNNEEDWNSFITWLEENFDKIFSKYENKILDHFRNRAIEDAEINYNPNDFVDWDLMPGGHDDYKFEESIDEGEDMKFKLVEAAESKICCICRKPFDGYGNNAEPVCSGSCCDECNMKEVIPARMEMLDDSSSEGIDESLNEGNSVSGKIPPALDSFLQDIAQMYETIDYGDIMDHDYTAEDLQKLAKLRGKFRREINYVDSDEDAAAVCEKIANDVAEILKSDNLDEAIDPSKALEVKKNSDADVIFYGYQYKNEKPIEFDPPKELSSDAYRSEVEKIAAEKTKLNPEAPRGNRYGHEHDFVFYALYNRKNEELNEGRFNPYFTPYGYRAAAKVLNRTAPEYYWHLKEIEMDRGDGIKLANYALKKGLPVMLDKHSDPDYPEFYLKDGSSEYHWGDYFYTYGFTNPDATDLVTYEGNLDILNAEKDDNKMNEVFGDIVNYESAEDWIKRIESQEGQISIFDDEDKDTFERFARDVYFYAKNNGFKRRYVEEDFIQFIKTSNIPEGELATYIDISGNTHDIHLHAQIYGSDGFLIGEKYRSIHNMAELKSGINEIKNDAVKNIEERENEKQAKAQEIAQKYAASASNYVLIGFNHFNPEDLIVIHDSKEDLETITDDMIDYFEIIPMTDKLLWITNNDEYLNVSNTNFNSIDEFKNAVVAEIQKNIDAGNNEFDILDLTSFYIDEDSEGLSAEELTDRFMNWIDESFVDGDSESAIYLIKGNELDDQFISYTSVEEFLEGFENEGFDDDMDFDIDESHETHLMDSLYEGSDDFDDHDDEEIIEYNDDSEDDERWDNDIIADAYDDEIDDEI